MVDDYKSILPVPELLAPGNSVIREVELLFATHNDPHRVSMIIAERATPANRDALKEAFSIVFSRRKAKERGFPSWAQQGLFRIEVLEQATHPEVATFHAGRFQGSRRLLEIGTGSTCDTGAFATTVPEIVTVDRDPVLVRYAQHNLELQLAKNVRCIVGEITTEWESIYAKYGPFDAIWADPSRRSNAGRTRNPENFSPPLPWLVANIDGALGPSGIAGIKVSPAAPVATPLGWSSEWVGFHGECKERILWKGPLGEVSCAVVVESGEKFTESVTEPKGVPPEASPEVSSGFILQPHPVLGASRLIAPFFSAHGISMLGGPMGYGYTDELPKPSGFYAIFRILEGGALDLKRLQDRITHRSWGPGTQIYKRGEAMQPEELHKRLRFTPGGARGDVILTVQGRKKRYYLCERVNRAAALGGGP